MKKILLTAAFAAIVASASAENKAYFFRTVDNEFEQMGQVYCVSPNGEYAVIYDEEMEHSFLWRRSEPDKIEFINLVRNGEAISTEVRGINDNGTIVGSAREKGSSQWQPFVKPMDGDVIPLPLTEWALNLNYPCRISNNEMVIGGQISGSGKDLTGGSIGQDRPAMWVKGSDGEYEVICPDKDELPLPSHQGVNVTGMYSDGTYENSYVFGSLACGAGSYIPFLFNQRELTLFNKIERVEEVPWYYKGKVVDYETVELIDGKRDYYFSENDMLSATFSNCDGNGNIYGTRVEIYDVEGTDKNDIDTFGKAKQRYYSGWYNLNTKEWTEVLGAPAITTGLGNGEVLFTSNNTMYDGGFSASGANVGTALGVDFGGRQMLGVERASDSGNTLGACYVATGAAGVQHIYPCIITLDEALVGIDSVTADADSQQVVLTYGGTIEVIGAEEVAVYDMNGVNVANGKVSNVGSGMYVVVADGVSHKVLVK